MNFSYTRAISIVTIFAFSSCLPLSMKVKSCIYDFINNLKNVDTSDIVCETTPSEITNKNPWDRFVVDPQTNLPLIKYSPFFSIIYIDNHTIESIRKNFTLPQEVKYTLLYRIGLLKITRKKYLLHNPLGRLATVSGLCSIVPLELGLIQWYECYRRKRELPGNAKSLIKIGAVMLALSGSLYFINKKIQKPIDPEQDTLDTMQKAHEFAKSMVQNNNAL